MESNEVATQETFPATSGEQEDQSIQIEDKAEAVTVQDPGDKAEASTQVNKNSEGSVIKASVDFARCRSASWGRRRRDR